MMKKARKEQIVLAYVLATGGRLPESLDNLLRGMREMIGDVSGCGSCWVSELAHLQSPSFITMSRPPMWGPVLTTRPHIWGWQLLFDPH
jgi:hypothetical protein